MKECYLLAAMTSQDVLELIVTGLNSSINFRCPLESIDCLTAPQNSHLRYEMIRIRMEELIPISRNSIFNCIHGYETRTNFRPRPCNFRKFDMIKWSYKQRGRRKFVYSTLIRYDNTNTKDALRLFNAIAKNIYAIPDVVDRMYLALKEIDRVDGFVHKYPLIFKHKTVPFKLLIQRFWSIYQEALCIYLYHRRKI